jgi:hypothetical protein
MPDTASKTSDMISVNWTANGDTRDVFLYFAGMAIASPQPIQSTAFNLSLDKWPQTRYSLVKVPLTVSPFRPSFPPQLNVFSQPFNSCGHPRDLKSCRITLLQTLCRSQKSQLLCNQSNAHSFAKTPGVGYLATSALTGHPSRGISHIFVRPLFSQPYELLAGLLGGQLPYFHNGPNCPGLGGYRLSDIPTSRPAADTLLFPLCYHAEV